MLPASGSYYFHVRNWSILLSQRQPLEVFYKKAVLKNFALFAGKPLCWCLF